MQCAKSYRLVYKMAGNMEYSGNIIINPGALSLSPLSLSLSLAALSLSRSSVRSQVKRKRKSYEIQVVVS